MKPDFRKILPTRPADSNKNDFGRVLIAAGSLGMTGAAYLSSKAALRSGAGIVYCATAECQRRLVARMLPETVTAALPSRKGFIVPSAASMLKELISKFKINVLAIGPGLGEGGRKFAVKALVMTSVPAVVDADALNALAEKKECIGFLKSRPCVLTPHEGEMKRLIGGFSDRRKAAIKLSKISGAVVLLKGRSTIVTDGEKIYENDTGCPAMAKAGSGDVLTGIIAGLWAQKGCLEKDFAGSAFDSAALGARLHGIAGELAARKKGERSLLAGEIIDFIGPAFRKIK
ncbi:MAG: hypothetical protein Fur0012_04500 [Elusimicrobiota bacterium]